MTTEFTDKVVLITSAGKGIGRALALAFAAQGAIIAANDITPVNLDAAAAEIESRGGRISTFVCDIAKGMPVEAMFAELIAQLGRLDILVNCASVAPQSAILDMDEWDWRRTLDFNLSGSFLTTQQSARQMRTQGGGAIVNITSTAALHAARPGNAAYAVSELGLLALTRCAAAEFLPYHIRVNAICLDGAEGGYSGQAPGDWQKVSRLALFLCSGAAAHLNGQAFDANGERVIS